MVHSNHGKRIIVLYDKTFKLSAVRISRWRSRVKCLTHTLLKAELRESES
jgi:hypothetical protein